MCTCFGVKLPKSRTSTQQQAYMSWFIHQIFLGVWTFLVQALAIFQYENCSLLYMGPLVLMECLWLDGIFMTTLHVVMNILALHKVPLLGLGSETWRQERDLKRTVQWLQQSVGVPHYPTPQQMCFLLYWPLSTAGTTWLWSPVLSTHSHFFLCSSFFSVWNKLHPQRQMYV